MYIPTTSKKASWNLKYIFHFQKISDLFTQMRTFFKTIYQQVARTFQGQTDSMAVCGFLPENCLQLSGVSSQMQLNALCNKSFSKKRNLQF
jgi:hypothetical protein